MLHTWYTTQNLASFYLQRSMWPFYPSIPYVIGAKRMCCENIVTSKFPSFSWNVHPLLVKKSVNIRDWVWSGYDICSFFSKEIAWKRGAEIIHSLTNRFKVYWTYRSKKSKFSKVLTGWNFWELRFKNLNEIFSQNYSKIQRNMNTRPNKYKCNTISEIFEGSTLGTLCRT